MTVFAGLIGANALTYLYYALSVRSLPVAEGGLFTSLVAAILTVSIPANVLATVLAKNVARANAAGDDSLVAAAERGSIILILPTVLLGLLCASFVNALEAFFHTADATVLLLTLGAAVIGVTLPVQRAVFQGEARFAPYGLSNVIEAAFKFFGAAASFKFGLGLRSLIGWYLLGVACAFVYDVASMRRLRAGMAGRTWWSPRLVDGAAGVATPTASFVAVTFADVLLVRHGLDARSSGLYGAAALLGRAILTVTQFVPTVVLPRAVAALHASTSSLRLLVVASAATAAVVLAILVPVAVFPGFAIAAIGGGRYAAAATIALPYAAAMSALALATTLASILMGSNRYAFVIPCAVVATAEIAGVALASSARASLGTIVGIVLTGHVTLLVVTALDALALFRTTPGGAAR